MEKYQDLTKCLKKIKFKGYKIDHEENPELQVSKITGKYQNLTKCLEKKNFRLREKE